MKKLLYKISIFLGGALVAVGLFQSASSVSAVVNGTVSSNATSSINALATTSIACAGPNCFLIPSFATSTASKEPAGLFMRPGVGTSTLKWAATNEGESVFIHAVASGSKSVLGVVYQASNNDQDWFTVPHTSTTNIGTSTISVGGFATSTVAHYISLDSTVSSTTPVALTFPEVFARFKRVVVFVPIMKGNASENVTAHLERYSAIISR